MEGALHGFADSARQVDVCRVDDDPVSILVDLDNAVERMLAFFGFLLMARQTKDLLLLLASEDATQFDDAGACAQAVNLASRARFTLRADATGLLCRLPN